jgi:uncharacterized protein (DUF952 family)
VTAAEWDEARRGGSYRGSALDARDGFMHLSAPGAVRETARRYYGAAREALVLLEVPLCEGGGGLARSLSDAGVALRWDYVESRREYFPHLLPPLLPVAAVRAAHALKPEGDAADVGFTFPDGV